MSPFATGPRRRKNKEPHSGQPLGTEERNRNRRHARQGRRKMNPYVVFLLYLAAILGFVGLTLLLNRMLGPKPVSSAVKACSIFSRTWNRCSLAAARRTL